MKRRDLKSAQFESFLRRLASDREQAGQRYEYLRRRLISLFVYRGCVNPEELADETLDRVVEKLETGSTVPDESDPAAFVFGIAWNVARESFHDVRTTGLPDGCDPVDPSPLVGEGLADARQEQCLDDCLGRLPVRDRSLVLTYFEKEKRAKIEQRALLADQLRITTNALRLRVHRILDSLRRCTVECAGNGDTSGGVTSPRPRGNHAA